MTTRSHRVRRLALDLGLALTTIAAVGAAAVIVVLQVGFTPVLTGSMDPTYRAGAVVMTVPRATADLAVGDAVILPIPDGSGHRYLHRITTIDRSEGDVRVRTRGDNNPLEDQWTLRIDSSTVPVAVASVAQLGHLSDALQATTVRLAVAAAVLLLALWGMTSAIIEAVRSSRARGRRSVRA